MVYMTGKDYSQKPSPIPEGRELNSSGTVTGLDDRGDSSTTGGTTTEHGGVSNDLVDALAGLVRHMRALEQSRRRAEQCFADYAAHSIKIILSEAKYDKDFNVGKLETKLAAMQTLLGEVEVEKTKANHLFTTLDSHLKMIARRTANHVSGGTSGGGTSTNQERGTGTGKSVGVRESSGVGAGNNPSGGSESSVGAITTNPRTTGAPFVKQSAGMALIGKQQQKSFHIERNLLQGFTRRKRSKETTGGSNSISERGPGPHVNETFSVDKSNSFLVPKYPSAHTSGAPPASSKSSKTGSSSHQHPQQQQSSGGMVRMIDLEKSSPRHLFQMLLRLEEEYDQLERERLDCMALRQSAVTSRQVAKRLDSREKVLRKELDKKAIQVDRVLRVLEPQFLKQMTSSSSNTATTNAVNTNSRANNQSQTSFATTQKTSPTSSMSSDSVVGNLSGGQSGTDMTTDFETTNASLSVLERVVSEGSHPKDSHSYHHKSDSRKHRRRRSHGHHKHGGSRGDKASPDKYHNVKLLREMKEFNRFLKSHNGSF